MEINEFSDWMDANFETGKTVSAKEWSNEFYQIELIRKNNSVLIWNKKNLRYIHFGPTDALHAAEWLKENKDVRPIVPEQFRIKNEYQ
jgi:hypothetical protein